MRWLKPSVTTSGVRARGVGLNDLRAPQNQRHTPSPRNEHMVSTIEAVIRRHSALIYFGLVFVISGGGILLVVGPGGFPLKAEQFASFGPLLYTAILAGPCVAGVLLTGIVDGWKGLRDLLARLRRWRHIRGCRSRSTSEIDERPPRAPGAPRA